MAGLSANAAVSVTVDVTPPVITATLNPVVNIHGWNKTDVMVNFQATDVLSGIQSVDGPVFLTTEGAGQVVTGQATDLAGNSASVSVEVRIDKTGPDIAATATPEANMNGWNQTDVTVSFSANDNLSGLDSVSPPVVLSEEGVNQAVSGTAADRAGNNTSSTAHTVNIDKTPPAITITSPEEGAIVNVSQLQTITGTVSDTLSGIAEVMCGTTPGVIADGNFTCEVLLDPGGDHVTAVATDNAGHTAQATVNLNLTRGPRVVITSPVTLTTVGASPIDVSGTVSSDAVLVFVNGIEAEIIDGGFTVTGIVLNEGMNTLAAAAYDTLNNVSTASVNITLDSTPPKIFINSPQDGAIVTSSPITVAGMINDIVRGTVNEAQGRVMVNGVVATVANRSFIVDALPLVEGANTITAVGADQTGNTATTSIEVILDVTPGKIIKIVSGNNQSAPINAALPQPFVVAVSDEDDLPVAGVTVIFEIIENNGRIANAELDLESGRMIALETDADGKAQVNLTLGSWAGSGNNKVKASAQGVQGDVTFIASATLGSAANIHVASGGQQRGAVNQLLPAPLVAIVTDEGYNPLANVPVVFTMAAGGGSFSDGEISITILTDSDGRAAANFVLGSLEGRHVHVVNADFSGNPGDTRISGVVLDNTNHPIPGVTLRVEGTTRQAVTDIQGQFLIENVPVGPVHLVADGSTSTLPGEYPTLMFELVTISGQDNTLGMPVYLLPLNTTNTQWVGGSEDVVYSLPEIPGFSLEIKAGSVTFPDGSNEGYISVTQVHPDKVPMAPPNGLQPRFIITIQPPGAVFDPPAPITLPNIDGLGPGEKTNMYSFDHDLGEFVSIGTGSVSEDRMLIVSDPGVGVIKAGWHCGSNPTPEGSAGSCDICEECGTNGMCYRIAECYEPCGNEGRCPSCYNCVDGQCELETRGDPACEELPEGCGSGCFPGWSGNEGSPCNAQNPCKPCLTCDASNTCVVEDLELC